MLSNRPYLLRAFYQWIIDSHCNPILVIDANNPRANIPQDYIVGEEIVFNISPTAVRDLKMLNDFIEFKASFTGVIHLISAPVQAILAIYAEENGEGIFFDAEEDLGEVSNGMKGRVPLKSIENTEEINISEQSSSNNTINKPKPFLRLIENDQSATDTK